MTVERVAHACHSQIARRANLAYRRVLPCRANQNDDLRVPFPHEGRFAIVTDVGSGTRWTRWSSRTSYPNADGEVVWSWLPDAGVKLAGTVPQVTVATKPGSPGRSRSKP